MRISTRFNSLLGQRIPLNSLSGADGGADAGQIFFGCAPTLNCLKSIIYLLAGQMGHIFYTLTREEYKKTTTHLLSRVKRGQSICPTRPAFSKCLDNEPFRVGRMQGSYLPRICPTRPSTNHANFMLDESKLEHVRRLSNGGIIARCPVCAANDGDKRGIHLKMNQAGQFTCVAFEGESGREHRKEIWKMAGLKDGKFKTEFRPPVIRYRLKVVEEAV